MRDFRDDFELDEDGRLRRKRVAGDGERYAFTMQMMDAAAGFSRTFTDGSVDHTHWSRPGFRCLDTDDANRIAADAAYESRRARVDYRTRYRQQNPPSEQHDCRDLGDANLRALADAAANAYEDRKVRKSQAWKQRPPDVEQDYQEHHRLARRAATATLPCDAPQRPYAERQRRENAWRMKR